jgi:DNA-binding MarR family transcriptional regulator
MMTMENKEEALHREFKGCIQSVIAFREFQRRAAGLNLTDKELLVLRAIQLLDEDKGDGTTKGVSIKAIADKMLMPNSTVSAAIGRLYREEYVDKGFERDRPREVVARLNEKGHSYIVAEEKESEGRRVYYGRATDLLAQKYGGKVAYEIVTEWLLLLNQTMKEALSEGRGKCKAAAIAAINHES